MALPSGHADFVSKFSKIVENSLKRNYADSADDAQTTPSKTKGTGENSKRPRLKVTKDPLEVRFQLGFDDNTYLQAGVALLNDGSHKLEETTVLAPTALYNSNLFDGIRKQVQTSIVQKYEKILEEEKGVLKKIVKELYAGDPQYSNYSDANKIDSLKNRLASDILQFKAKPPPLPQLVPSALPQDDGAGDGESAIDNVAEAEAALVNRLFRSTDDGFKGYVMARGLIGSRGPHEPALPGDEHLQYTVPRNIARTIERIKQERLPPPAHVPEIKGPSPEAVRVAVHALNGNLALDELEKCDEDDGPDVLVARPRQVRWLPEGPHGEDIAAAAALEHAHARCLRVADTDARLNDEAKWALRLIAGRLKTRQLKHMYRISRASQLGELPPTPSREVLVTRREK